ncbi:MAG: tyrosine-type recombinase/integrase [Sulfolobaceae archaeon]|nr:tyrosine-type recombinase/integrase [Stygiolobus sp.]MDT7875549.1 tyrosine-type recombinase/integrase [Sulfolobaceae archaeon]
MKLQLGQADTVVDPYNDFINSLLIAGASENTIKVYSIAVKDFLNYIKKDPRTVTASDVNNWIINVMRRGTRDKKRIEINEMKRRKMVTARLYIIAVLRFLKWLGKDIKPVTPRIRRNEIFALDEETFNKLLEITKRTSDKLILKLLFDTGLRAKELLSIKVSDIDFERGSITVRNTKNQETRTVFFTEGTKSLLIKYIKSKGLKSDDKLFNLTYNALYKRLKRIGKKIGIDLRPHLLRHTFATVAIKKGVPLPAVQKLLGHKDIRTTQIYTHLLTTDLENIYRKTFG